MRRAVVPAVATLTAVALLVAMLHLLMGVGLLTGDFASARIDASQTANAQRDVLVLQTAVLRLPETRDVAGTELRRDLVLQQLDTLRRRQDGAALQVPLDRLTRLDVPGLLRGAGHEERLEDLDAWLRDLERELKGRYDERDQAFQGLIADALTTRTAAQRLVAVLVVLAMTCLVAWTIQSRRRSAGDVAMARRAARSTEQRFHTLVRNSSDLTLMLDERGTITWASPAARSIAGREPGDLVGTRLAELVAADDLPDVALAVTALREGTASRRRFAFRLRHADGSTRHVDVRAVALLDDPDVAAIVVNVRDVTDRRLLEDELYHLAYHDPLTGLPNRALLQERLEEAAARRRVAGQGTSGMALLLVDLDDFKAVNDGLGHDQGDRLLLEVARRLQECTRPTDTVARLGGDEFVVFAPEVADLETVTVLSERIARALADPLVLGGHVVPLGASVGVRFVDGDDLRPEHLLRDADIAMYAAKSAGKNTWALFEDQMHDEVANQLTLRAELVRAIDEDELVVHYQPIVDATSEQITGFEALVRWAHPTEGLLGPHRFIELAEESGLIVGVGEVVLREAAGALARLHALSGRRDLTMSVNVSPRQLELADVAATLRDVLDEAGIAPSSFVVEVTEGVFLDDSSLAADRLAEIRALGVQLALDDFGTGYSSLSYIARLPLDVLKIDRSFVSAMETDPSRAALVETIVRLGTVLGLRTVAEGVETEAQLVCLQALDCASAQGWLFGRPVPEAELRGVLELDLLRSAA